MDCDDIRDDRLDALYGEAGEEALRRVATHHSQCEACRAEFDALRGVRRRLTSWKLPPRLLPWQAAPPRRRLAGLAVAAGLLLTLGGALRLSGASLEYSAGPVRVRVGAPDIGAQIAERAAHHDEAIRSLQAALGASAARPAAQDQEAILRKVQEMLRESDARQALRLNAGLETLAKQAEAQRRYDLARVSAGLSYLDGKTGQHMARTSELMGYVLQASDKR